MYRPTRFVPLRAVVCVWLTVFLLPGVLSIVSPLPARAQARLAEEPSFAAWGQSEQTARTMYGVLSYYFPIPTGHVPVSGTELVLDFSHSRLLQPERSTMTVVVNGQSLASVPLDEENQAHGTMRVDLPVADDTGNFDAAGYFVELRFHQRLTLDECEEFNNPAHWTTVHDTSQLRLLIRPQDAPPGLEAVDAYFTPMRADMPLSALRLPAEPSPAELEAAGLAAFQQGRWAAAVGEDVQLAVTQDLDDFALNGLAPNGLAPNEAADDAIARRPLVVVGAGERLAADAAWGDLAWDGGAFVHADAESGNGAAPAGAGVLAIGRAPASDLLISGSEDTAVVDAARALVQPAWRTHLTGTHTLVALDALTPTQPAAVWQTGAASFAQLGQSEPRTVTGPGLHTVEYFFQRPPAWDLVQNSALELAIAASPALRAETSWVGVTINGYAAGALPLDRTTGEEGGAPVYRFTLPGELLSATLDRTPTRDLNLQVQLMLDLPQDACEIVNGEAARASIEPTSAWLLRHRTPDALNLGRFPWPLLAGAGMDEGWPLTVVLPAEPSAAEVEAGLYVMAALGRWSGALRPGAADGELPVLTTADAVDPQTREESAWITLGGAGRNTLTAAVIEQIPSVGETPDPAAYQLGASTPIASLNLVVSPWNTDRAVLVITAGGAGADAPEALLSGARSLGRGETIRSLRGQRALLGTARAPQLIADDAPVPAPDALAPQVVVPLAQRAPAWQIIGAVLLGAFVAVVIILLMALMRRRRPMG